MSDAPDADPRPRIVPPFVVDAAHGTPAAPLVLGCEPPTLPGYVRCVYVARSLHAAVLAAPPWELPDIITARFWLPPPLGNGRGSKPTIELVRLTSEMWRLIKEKVGEAELKSTKGEIDANAWRDITARFLALDAMLVAENEPCWSWRTFETQSSSPYEKPKRVPVDPSAVKKLVGFFVGGLMHTKVRFIFPGGYVLAVGMTPDYSGDLAITNDGSPPLQSFGRINESEFIEGPYATPELTELVLKMLGDPVKYANDYGLRTGRCCFCGQRLTNAGFGYGPVCAKRYGLAWTASGSQDQQIGAG